MYMLMHARFEAESVGGVCQQRRRGIPEEKGGEEGRKGTA